MPLGPGHNQIMKTYDLLGPGNVHMHFIDVSPEVVLPPVSSPASQTVPAGEASPLGKFWAI